MVKLQRFTTQYKGAEDRILLIGEDKVGEVVSLWLTQRLLLKTVPVLVEWLQKNNPVDLRTKDNSAQAREMTQVFSRKPVRPKASATSQMPENSETAAAVVTVEEPILIHSIDLNLNDKLLRLRFRHGDRELGNLTLNGSQLRQWLAVLHVLWRNAGWPTQIWPRWLSEDTKLVSNQTQGAFH